MTEKRTVKMGIIGLGARAETLLASMFEMEAVDIAGICDVYQEKIDRICSIFDKHGRKRPTVYHDYHQMLDNPEIEGIFIPTSWNSHLQIACDCMRKGKYAGIEVGGAASLEELWDLVRASESTGVSCMMLENCCYARNELMVKNMVAQGLFGELVYCEGGYEHGLGDELAQWYSENRERTTHNIKRNGELYPTHALGPLAKILKINQGNRFLTLSSHSTKSVGYTAELQNYLGKTIRFNCGDVTTTVIHCANGENITLTHCISLPRPYSRDCRVQGTKGIWLENANSIYLDGHSPKYTQLDVAGNPYMTMEWEPVESFYEKYDHPIWREYREHILGGHGGVDFLTLNAFTDAIRRQVPTPIDVYDCAAWMCITCLSEQSVAMGGMPVAIPDFTNGKWIDRETDKNSKWAL